MSSFTYIAEFSASSVTSTDESDLFRGGKGISKDLNDLVGRPTAADVEDAAGRERAVLGSQPADQCGDFVDFHEASHGDLGAHVVDVFRCHLREDLGLGGGGRDAVHQDVLRRQFLTE